MQDNHPSTGFDFGTFLVLRKLINREVMWGTSERIVSLTTLYKCVNFGNSALWWGLSSCLDLSLKGSERKAWHLDQTTWICNVPMISSLSIQLWHCPARTSVPGSETMFAPSQGKILLGQARYWGLQRLRQPLYLHLGAFEQMNVNSRSNITRGKLWGIDCGGFFSSACPYDVVIEFPRIFTALHSSKETA